MKIYLTRHSKTIWNQQKRLQGHKNSLLTLEGQENAKALKNYIQQQNLHFDAIFSSPIERAYQTASLIFDPKDIIVDDRLKEMNFGIFEGQKISELLKRDDHLYDDLWHHPEKFTRIPEGESYDDVMIRARSFLEDLKKYDDHSQVMIVTHGMFFIVLLAVMLNLEKKDFIQINQNVVEGCSLTIVELKQQTYQIISYNQRDFLPHVSNQCFTK